MNAFYNFDPNPVQDTSHKFNVVYRVIIFFLNIFLWRLFEKLVEDADEKKKAFAEFEKYDLKLREVNFLSFYWLTVLLLEYFEYDS